MKKKVQQLLSLALCLLLCLSVLPGAVFATDDGTIVVDPAITPEVTATPEPTPTPTPTPTPSPTPVPAPVITKNPTGEVVDEGGTAYFVARADYADTIQWRLVSADGNTTYNAKDASRYFGGLEVDGADEEMLTLSNIPYALDGWKAECRFVGASGAVVSEGATITVNRAAMRPAVINGQPTSVSRKAGESAILAVSVTDPNNGTLHYQWYRNDQNSNAGGTQIPGATSSTYTPEQTEGTVYYYVAVWSTLDERQTTPVNSAVASVTYSGTAVDTATPTPTATTAPTVTPTPSDDGSSAKAARRSGANFLLILMIILIIALVVSAVALIFLSRKERLAAAADEDEDDEPQEEEQSIERESEDGGITPVIDTSAFDDDGWYCTKCGAYNTGKFCTECGAAHTIVELKPSCQFCGWILPEGEEAPKFCPECGKPFGK